MGDCFFLAGSPNHLLYFLGGEILRDLCANDCLRYRICFRSLAKVCGAVLFNDNEKSAFLFHFCHPFRFVDRPGSRSSLASLLFRPLFSNELANVVRFAEPLRLSELLDPSCLTFGNHDLELDFSLDHEDRDVPYRYILNKVDRPGIEPGSAESSIASSLTCLVGLKAPDSL